MTRSQFEVLEHSAIVSKGVFRLKSILFPLIERFETTNLSNLRCKAGFELPNNLGASFAISNRYEAVTIKLVSLLVSCENSAFSSSSLPASSSKYLSY